VGKTSGRRCPVEIEEGGNGHGTKGERKSSPCSIENNAGAAPLASPPVGRSTRQACGGSITCLARWKCSMRSTAATRVRALSAPRGSPSTVTSEHSTTNEKDGHHRRGMEPSEPIISSWPASTYLLVVWPSIRGADPWPTRRMCTHGRALAPWVQVLDTEQNKC
jgi:hypothetical protein